MTILKIQNPHGAFVWHMDYGGPASLLAKAAFREALIGYYGPEMDTEITGPTCPKCGGIAEAEWLPKGERRDLNSPVLLGRFGRSIGKKQFVAEHECLLRECNCGYSWLGPVDHETQGEEATV